MTVSVYTYVTIIRSLNWNGQEVAKNSQLAFSPFSGCGNADIVSRPSCWWAWHNSHIWAFRAIHYLQRSDWLELLGCWTAGSPRLVKVSKYSTILQAFTVIGKKHLRSIFCLRRNSDHYRDFFWIRRTAITTEHITKCNVLKRNWNKCV